MCLRYVCHFFLPMQYPKIPFIFLFFHASGNHVWHCCTSQSNIAVVIWLNEMCFFFSGNDCLSSSLSSRNLICSKWYQPPRCKFLVKSHYIMFYCYETFKYFLNILPFLVKYLLNILPWKIKYFPALYLLLWNI